MTSFKLNLKTSLLEINLSNLVLISSLFKIKFDLIRFKISEFDWKCLIRERLSISSSSIIKNKPTKTTLASIIKILY